MLRGRDPAGQTFPFGLHGEQKGGTYTTNSSNLLQTLFPVLFLIFVHPESRFLKKIRGFTFFSDFHALRSPAVETERQNRSEWQAKLGRRRNGFPPSHRWTDLH